MILWDRLRIDWSVNEQYAYGWFVPPLAMALLALRWRDRPQPSEPGRGNTRRLLVVAATVCLTLLLPVRWLEEPNGDWRLLPWLHAGLLVSVTLLAAAWIGGRAWTRHFAFPVLFLLLALCWPLGIEQTLVQTLMRTVAGIAAEIMNLLGIPAEQQGNLIRVRNQMVGVNEACSGIRSLQTVIMAALFLGELSRLSWQRRLALLAGGVAVAMVANVFRSSLLVWIAANYGSEQLERYHDTAGLSVLVIVFAGLLAINSWLERSRRGAAALKKDLELREEKAVNLSPRGALILLPRAVPLPFVAAALAWLVACEIGIALWYRAHERNRTILPSWTVVMPTAAPGFKSLPTDDVTRGLLRFDTANLARWRCPGESRTADCTMYFFRWEPGRLSASMASIHTPAACLPASGLTQVADNGNYLCTTRGGVTLPVHEYEYTLHDQHLYVYYVVWRDQAGAVPTDEKYVPLGRVHAALRGERNSGQQTLECVITGPKTTEEARTIFERQMNEVIRRKD